MDKLLAKFSHYPLVEKIDREQNGQTFSFVEEALAITTSYLKRERQIIVVKESLYQAEQLFEHIANLVDNTHLYLVEESKRLENIAASPELRADRLACLNMLQSGESGIYITHTAGLLRYVPEPSYFTNCVLNLQVGDNHSQDDLRKRIIQAGYQLTNRVDQPLTFAIRGGVIDIYSINYEYPIRIEFFDTEIDSIRFFDLNTQMTIEQTNIVNIIPATDILFNIADEALIINKLNSVIDTADSEQQMSPLIGNLQRDILYLQNKLAEINLYQYYGYLPARYSILDYCYEPTIITSSVQNLIHNETLLVTETIDYRKELFDEGQSPLILEQWLDLKHLLAKHKSLNIDNVLGVSTDYDTIHQIDVPIQEFNYVMEDIIKLASNNRILLCLSEAEITQVSGYLIQQQVKFARYQDELPIGITLLHHNLAEGFYYHDLYVYSSQEVFNTKIKVTRYTKRFNDAQVINDFDELKQGDYIVHNSYGVGKYIGIETKEINGIKRDFLHVVYRGDDELFVPLQQFSLVRKFVSREGVAPKLNKLGSNEWNKTKEKLAESINDLAERLVKLYSTRKMEQGFQFSSDQDLEAAFANEVEFKLTEDQDKAISEIEVDMMSDTAMDRLLIGDVGFGKTEVSMRAAFKAVYNGKQVAFLCPTTILSSQHFQTFRHRFYNFNLNIQVLNRFITKAEQTKIIKDLAEGKVDIIIGTHRILSKDIKFKDLGLLIIDEEQRFGVEHKERIKEISTNVDVLSLSATPIPRTLQMSLVGIRSLSTLNQAPKNRKPVQTYVIERNTKTINHVIERELARQGQAFYLHNNTKYLNQIAIKLKQDITGVNVGVVHGQMDKDEIEEVMIKFTLHEYDVLVCTTIIETGIDIANANTIIIDNADHFGLSQLYQIRGRVGRSDRLAYAYLMYTPQKQITEIAAKRLDTIKEFTQLGSGYKIAMRDLTIRGAGDMLGPQQSGFIDTVGIDMYLEMLNKAINLQQGKEEVVVENNDIRIEGTGHIPEKFTDYDYDKITLYQQIDAQADQPSLSKYRGEIIDFYGELPEDVLMLFERRQLELLINAPQIDSYKEKARTVEVAIKEVYSEQMDGIKFFATVSEINPLIKLAYQQRKIKIVFPKEKNWINDIIKVLSSIEYER